MIFLRLAEEPNQLSHLDDDRIIAYGNNYNEIMFDKVISTEETNSPLLELFKHENLIPETATTINVSDVYDITDIKDTSWFVLFADGYRITDISNDYELKATADGRITYTIPIVKVSVYPEIGYDKDGNEYEFNDIMCYYNNNQERLSSQETDGPRLSSNITSFEEIKYFKSLKKIPFNMFYQSSISALTIPEFIEEVGEQAFLECNNLESIIIPDTVLKIGGGAFYKCENLKSIKLSNALTEIMSYTFQSCTALNEIVIPNSVTSINEGAFYECTSLTGITIPVSLTNIEEAAFNYCTALTTIKYDGTTEQWKAISKVDNWYMNIPSTTKITCSNGELALNA